MIDGPESDNDLLAGIRSGDEQAFVTLYRKRHTALYRFVLHMTGSASTAEDVTQEVFLALIREGCGYDPGRGSLSGYLFGIARKLVLKHLERTRTLAEQDLESQDLPVSGPASADPMVDLMRREGIEELRRAVLALPKRYREVVVLCDLQEIDYADAAALLDCPIGTVRSRLHRARALLLEKLRPKREPQSSADALKLARSLI
jgi:RNA polymerase sigma-70 factor (ECF subfamily)